MSFTKSTEPKDNGESRVFCRASTIECHHNDVFYEGSTNSISVINIACPLRSPHIQRTAWKSRVLYTASTIVVNVIKMIHKQGSTKGPQTQLVSSTSHVLYAVHRSNALCGHFKSSTKHHGLSACRRYRVSFTKSTNPTDKMETLCSLVFFFLFLFFFLTKSSHTAVIDVLRAFLQRFLKLIG